MTKKPYVCGDGKKFASAAEACAHAAKVFSTTGVVISVVKV